MGLSLLLISFVGFVACLARVIPLWGKSMSPEEVKGSFLTERQKLRRSTGTSRSSRSSGKASPLDRITSGP